MVNQHIFRKCGKHFKIKKNSCLHFAKNMVPHVIHGKRNRNIQVFTYQAIYFGEEIYGRRVIGEKGAIVGRQGAYVLGAVKPLREGLIYGGYKVDEGTVLAPGAIVTPNSNIIEN